MGRGRRAPRQADIARVAGVSQATVSVVLGGNRTGVRLSERTRLRVLEAAEQLGYVPDPVATRLTSARNNLIGLYTFTPVFPIDSADAHYPILAGVEAEAAALGKDLIMFTGSSAEKDHVGIRRTRLADGCLFLGDHVPLEPVRALVESGFPIVYIGRRTELDGAIPYVGGDYATASAEVVTRLVRAGHRQIRYLRSPGEAPPSPDCVEGVFIAAARHGLDPRGLVVRTDGEDLTADVVRGWADEGVTALVVDETGTGALYRSVDRALRSAALRVPAEVSVAVLGRPPPGLTGPVVSGFEVPRRAMGAAAVRLLTTLLDPVAESLAPHCLLPCPAVEGQTIAPVREGPGPREW